MSREILGEDNLESNEDDYSESLNNDEGKLTTPSEWTDVTLIVEKKKIYSSRAILASASPVWRAVLNKKIQEKDLQLQHDSEINLTGKLYSAVLEFLLCITPGINKLITSKYILPIMGCKQTDKHLFIANKSWKNTRKYVNSYGRANKNIFLSHIPFI